MNNGLRIAVILGLMWMVFGCEEESSLSTGDEVLENIDDYSNDINGNSATSLITCPACGYSKTEVLPTEVCQIVYTCEACLKNLTPLEGDCCVFCSYGTHKCPSMQVETDTLITVTSPAIDTLNPTSAKQVVRKTTTTKKVVKKVIRPADEVEVDIYPPDPFDDPDYIGTPCGDYVDGMCTRHPQCRK